MEISLVWMRRDLRLFDHAALTEALAGGGVVQPVFIFDTDILGAFPAKDDRRLSFLAATLCHMHGELLERGGGMLVFHGRAEVLVPAIAKALNASRVVAAEDYEPATRERDAHVAELLGDGFTLVKDHVVFSPMEILREGDLAYKVFTPYAKAWRGALTPEHIQALPLHDKGRYGDHAALTGVLSKAGLAPLSLAGGPEALLEQIGYRYTKDALWTVDDAPARLADFLAHKAKNYKQTRDFMAVEGTSRLSPYLRFGLVSARQCVAGAVAKQADTWLNELIWREFYATILYHYPESATQEWNPKYRDVLDWSSDKALFAAWQEGRTGYPLVDAAMRQLLAEGWMHNRARMVVASFLTKHLRIDWRMGEAHFAQYLMDYDLASNVGGWQWAASTGTDAQPYFRVFNPMLQSEKFDVEGDYIRRFVPELAKVSSLHIHAPWEYGVAYTRPVVVHSDARAAAIAMFKTAS